MKDLDFRIESQGKVIFDFMKGEYGSYCPSVMLHIKENIINKGDKKMYKQIVKKIPTTEKDSKTITLIDLIEKDACKDSLKWVMGKWGHDLINGIPRDKFIEMLDEEEKPNDVDWIRENFPKSIFKKKSDIEYITIKEVEDMKEDYDECLIAVKWESDIGWSFIGLNEENLYYFVDCDTASINEEYDSLEELMEELMEDIPVYLFDNLNHFIEHKEKIEKGDRE